MLRAARGLSLIFLAATTQEAQSQTATFDFQAGVEASTSRSADSGPGQPVTVSQNVSLRSFSFYTNMPLGGTAKFMIFDGSNSNLLTSTTVALAASSTRSWVNSGSISYTLVSGSTYNFGIIADNNICRSLYKWTSWLCIRCIYYFWKQYKLYFIR